MTSDDPDMFKLQPLLIRILAHKDILFEAEWWSTQVEACSLPVKVRIAQEIPRLLDKLVIKTILQSAQRPSLMLLLV